MSETKEWTGKEILALPMKLNDAGATTIRAYLVALLSKLWSEGESFSGKRPFGNSGWEHDLEVPLVAAGVVDGALDDEGYVKHIDQHASNDAIFSAIDALLEATP